MSCALTGLSIHESAVLLLTAKQGQVLGEPLWGCDGYYGYIQLERVTATARALWRLLRYDALDQEPDLTNLSETLRIHWPCPVFEGEPLHLRFVIGELFGAAVADTLSSERRLELRAQPWDALFQQAFRDHPVPYCMFGDRPSEERETMRDALVEVIGFQPFERLLGDSGVQRHVCSRACLRRQRRPNHSGNASRSDRP
jgi:hypothetical protein